MKHHETIFQVDFLDVILILTQPLQYSIYIGASWGGGLRPPVFDLENRCQGGSAELYEGGYLTILEPPPFLFSSRACLSRQVFLRKQLS